MRHEIVLEGAAYRLRPVRDADAGFIVELRGNPALNRYLHPGAANVEQQLAWLDKYHERPNDFFFVLEHRESGRAEGLVAIYDAAAGIGEWGRWILRPGSTAAVESAWLIYRCAFERLGLREVFCRTVADNRAVVSFHDSCGIVRRALLAAQFTLHGQVFDAVEHRVSREEWPSIAPRLEMLATRSARRTARA